MRLLTAGILMVLAHLALTVTDEGGFKRMPCYKYGLENLPERMPLSMSNFVSLLEKFEDKHNFNPDVMAQALINRYRTDGITYLPDVNAAEWSVHDFNEVNKQDFIKTLFSTDAKVPADTYDFREECTLHFMMSHSVDLYPHAGLNYVWENPRRRRRSLAGGQLSGESQSRYALPQGMNPATHPIENGVIWTPYGPVALGTLLTAIMIYDSSYERRIDQVFDETRINFMPTPMSQTRLKPLYAGTLSGDIGQAALIGILTTTISVDEQLLSPSGLFANSTAAPKLFTFEKNYDNIIPYMTRAEIFAGIDGLLIQKVLRGSSLKLSEALRLYYSEHGLPGYPHYRACNRMAAFNELDRQEIEDQALYFMYGSSINTIQVRYLIEENNHDFQKIEQAFKNALDRAMNQFTRLVDSYDYIDYERCPAYNKNEVMCENKVDLLTVFGYESGESAVKDEREYITHLAQLVDVGLGVSRSRIGIMDGKSSKWILPMSNFSNVADWGSNFTENLQNEYGSGSDMEKVLEGLKQYYDEFYKLLRSDFRNASANSQVVLWNAPNSIPNKEEFILRLEEFKLNYPDVYFLYVGKSEGTFTDIMRDPEMDFFSTTSKTPEEFARLLAKRICQIPSAFVYPACNPDDSNFSGVDERSHSYTGYVSPNYTTYVRISPYYFQYSRELKLMVDSGNVKVCGSRESMSVDINAVDYECQDDEIVLEHLCGRWLSECDPIYLSVRGATATNDVRCTDDECQYPNQIRYTLRHEGMTCGAWTASASLLTLALACLLLLFRP